MVVWGLCCLGDEHESFCFMDLVIFGCQQQSTVGHGKNIERAGCEQVTNTKEKVASTVREWNKQGVSTVATC